jgi:hypothetical protein
MKVRWTLLILFTFVIGTIGSPVIAQDIACMRHGALTTGSNAIEVSISQTLHDDSYTKHKNEHHPHDEVTTTGTLKHPHPFSINYNHYHFAEPHFNVHVLGADGFHPQVTLTSKGDCFEHVAAAYIVNLPGFNIAHTDGSISDRFVYRSLSFSAKTHKLHITKFDNSAPDVRDFLIVADPLFLKHDKPTHVAVKNTIHIDTVTAYMIALHHDVDPQISTKHAVISNCSDLTDYNNHTCNLIGSSTATNVLDSFYIEGAASGNSAYYNFQLGFHQYDSAVAFKLNRSKDDHLEFELHGGTNTDGYYMLLLHIALKP